MFNKTLILALVALTTASCSGKMSQDNAATNVKKSTTREIIAENNAAESRKEESAKGERVVFFDTDKFFLTNKAKETLNNEVLIWMKESPKMNVVIKGYCDERGTAAHNKKLGKNRAEAVKKYLVENGIKSSRVKTVSYGSSDPVDAGHDEKAWAKNRHAVTISAQ